MLKQLWSILSVGVLSEPTHISLHSSQDATENLKQTIQSLYGGKALRIRHVDAGSINTEEYELTALGNAYYDVEQFGLSFVASPRHADILTVSGPVTRNMEHALRQCYEMTPHPCIVIAVGDGACTGGIWKDSYAVSGPVKDIIPVDFEIPGDPPSPDEIIKGLTQAILSAHSKK